MHTEYARAGLQDPLSPILTFFLILWFIFAHMAYQYQCGFVRIRARNHHNTWTRMRLQREARPKLSLRPQDLRLSTRSQNE
jgi:hypothetical protein